MIAKINQVVFRSTGRCIRFFPKTYVFSNSKKPYSDSVLQSPYYRPRISVQDFLNQNGIEFRGSSSTYRIRQCPFCPKPHYNDLTNLFTLNVQKDSGVYYCHRCGAKGSWMDLRAKVLGIDQTKLGSAISEDLLEKSPHGNSHNEISDVEFAYYVYNMEKDVYQETLEYLKDRGFTLDTLQKYHVGTGVESFYCESGQPIDVKVIYFPMYRPKYYKRTEKFSEEEKNERELVKAKIRGVGAENKKYMRQFPTGNTTGFFGLNTIKHDQKFVVLTEGQFDAMAVYQATGYPAISLPQGANHLPDAIVPYLNQFEKIVLWMDNDEAGKVGEEKIAYKLGLDRTFLVKNSDSDYKDANDFLLNEPSRIKEMIDKAKSIPGQNILTFMDLKDSVRNRILKHEEYCGIQIQWLSYFNKKVKGIRMQELSIVSGPTGCGKTTFLSQISIDLLKKDIPVLWGSFQVRNEILITNMLMQYCSVNLNKNKSLFDYYADQFKNLPLYCLSFYGSNDVEKVLGTIEYAIQKYNISFVVLDTLQFFLSEQAEGIKRFDLQDKVMARLRKIATDYKIHMVVVIHPRKTEDSEDISIHSIYGTSKATQEADNIWIVQNRDNFRIFDVKKNRYDGEIGKAAMGFNKSTKSFVELTKKQLSILYNKQATIEQIIEAREKKEEQNEFTFTLQEESPEAMYISEEDIMNAKRKKKFDKFQKD